MPIIVSKTGLSSATVVDKSHFEKERHLQEYIHQHPEAIPVYDIQKDKRLFVAAREFATTSGPIDALAVDKDGDVYIVETKLYANPDKRRVVAQALDYGASLWKHFSTPERFFSALDEHVQRKWGMDFRDKVQEFFSLTDEQAANLVETIGRRLKDGDLKFVVLMDSIDDSLKDLLTYVNQKSQFDIYGVELEYYKHEEYEIVIPKIYGTEIKKDSATTWNDALKQAQEQTLLTMATERRTSALVDICRQMKDVWSERIKDGSSFRYWAPRSGRVFGVDISGQLANPPLGELDVWVHTDKLATVTGVAKAAIETRLSQSFNPSAAGGRDFVIRLKTTKEAELLISTLKAFVAEQAKTSGAVPAI